jgi:bilin biosynthesis protein
MTQDAFFAQLKHPNPNLRDQATYEIVDSRDENTIPRLMAALDDEDTTYRRAAVKALGMVGFDTVLPLVEALLKSENVTVRGSAAKALAQVAINYPEQPFPAAGLDGLKQSLNDGNPVVTIGATMALGQIGLPALNILVEALETTEDVALQVSIVNALGSIGGEEVKRRLQTVADNENTDSYVRETAVSAISRLDFVKGNTRS